jgi:hypothetical protein
VCQGGRRTAGQDKGGAALAGERVGHLDASHGLHLACVPWHVLVHAQHVCLSAVVCPADATNPKDTTLTSTD